MAAAFGRLCVETNFSVCSNHKAVAAAFGRLCVETILKVPSQNPVYWAAAFGRLCVETLSNTEALRLTDCSRLRAAVC